MKGGVIHKRNSLISLAMYYKPTDSNYFKTQMHERFNDILSFKKEEAKDRFRRLFFALLKTTTLRSIRHDFFDILLGCSGTKTFGHIPIFMS